MSILNVIVSLIVQMAIFGGLLLWPAGTLQWWRAWVLLGVVLVAAAATTAVLFAGHEDLLRERFKPPLQKGQPLADKIVLLLFIAAFLGLIAFIPLDVFHLHLLRRPAVMVSSLGLVLFIAGWWIVALALRENPFAAPVVRHQKERQQRVIASGAYAIVRHPMYAGAVALLLGLPLWLESYAGALLASLPIALLVLRIVIEERFLRRELRGYDTYTRSTRYRLIPFLW